MRNIHSYKLCVTDLLRILHSRVRDKMGERLLVEEDSQSFPLDIALVRGNESH